MMKKVRDLVQRKTIGNGFPDSVFNWTQEMDSKLSNQDINNQAFSSNKMTIIIIIKSFPKSIGVFSNAKMNFEFLKSFLKLITLSYSRAMKAVGVCEGNL
ncbi:unnamed protein product, partial [Vitis vinifera]|uniref:Uncharacterized protein n=1 Tax=Vitis vinifera TaxID=29760 RepID=D7U3Q9_VITVI